MTGAANYTLRGEPVFIDDSLSQFEPIPVIGFWRRLRLKFEFFLRRIGAEIVWTPLPTERQVADLCIYRVAGLGYVMCSETYAQLKSAVYANIYSRVL